MKTPILLLICILIVAGYAATGQVTSNQSSFDPSTFQVYTIGQPRRLDPSSAYDTASGELISNVYENLISFSDKHVLPAQTTNVSTWGYADLSQFEPILAASMPIISPDRKTWTFTIRSGVPFHPWKTASGILVANQILTAEDVEYTFKRMLVQDMPGSPSWMFCVPGTGYMFYDALDQNGATNTIEPLATLGAGERLVSSLIDDFITRNGNTVTFNFQTAWPETAVMQIFSQTWGCIVNKAFCIEHGCWNGTFHDGWSTQYRRMPSTLYSPLDRYYNTSKYNSNTPGPNTGTLGDIPAMCGTGSYTYTLWDKAAVTWTFNKFPGYWKGWTGKHVDTIIEKGIDAWPTRKVLFLRGEGDKITVPRANMQDLLQSSRPYIPVEGVSFYYSAPALSNEVMIFNFDVAPNSPYVPKVGGARRSDFFTDVHLRRAFAYAFNYTRYIQDGQLGDVLHPASWWVKGLVPDYENKNLKPYDIDLIKVEEELQAGGVWNSGFEVCLIYVLSSDNRRYPFDNIKDSIESLNTKRPGLTPFNVTVVGLDWPKYLEYEEEYYLPFYAVGWLADFADPDNFVRPYMHVEPVCLGNCLYGPPFNATVDELIHTGLAQPNGPERNQTYQTLQYIYWDEAWGIPLTQAVANFWFRDWVRGFSYNPLHPGLYFYDLYKEIPGPMEPVDVSVL